MQRHVLLGWVFACCAAGLLPSVASAVELRLATAVAPSSQLGRLLDHMGTAIASRTQGRVTVRWHYAGSQGDDLAVTRKIRLGQLEGGMVGPRGLSLLVADATVFELPRLLQSVGHLALVRARHEAHWDQLFSNRSMIRLAWTDAGWTHVFTVAPVATTAALRATKVGVSSDSAVQRTFFARLGVESVPLGAAHLDSSLVSGRVTAVVGTPQDAVAGQWNTRAKHAVEQPLGYEIGALVMAGETWARLTANDQQTVRTAAAELEKKFGATVRDEASAAVNLLKRRGVTFAAMPADMMGDVDGAARTTRSELADKAYAKSVLDQIVQAVPHTKKVRAHDAPRE